MFALTFNGVVIQIEAAIFPVSSSMEWIDISTEPPGVPQVGWLFDRGNFTAPPPIVRPPKEDAALSAEEVATELVREGIITQAEVDAIKTSR